jgi:exodeoxyribonuclease VII large subunit
MFPETGTMFPEQEEPLRVSLVKLSAQIARSLAGLGRVAVEGEVVDPKVMAGGQVYLTLRDRAARMAVYCPAIRSRYCRTVPGERVRVTGRVEYLSGRGSVQLKAEEVVPVGEGAVAAAIAESRARLEAGGLLERPKRPLPVLPRVVGVVCGGGSAVRKDIESVRDERFPGYPMAVKEVGVSGAAAAEGIADALDWLGGLAGVEVVVLARGGGDATDLLAFSDEELCRRVARCPVPVVSAIGHHGDRPLCDEVADLRCATPSLAATAVIPDRAALQESLDGQLSSATSALGTALRDASSLLEASDPLDALEGGLAAAFQRLGSCQRALGMIDLAGRARDAQSRLDARRWAEPLHRRLAHSEKEMTSSLGTLQALDPAKVLERGYAVVRSLGGDVVRSAGAVSAGDGLDVSLAEGGLRVTVDRARARA